VRRRGRRAREAFNVHFGRVAEFYVTAIVRSAAAMVDLTVAPPLFP
jgi:hypothetical protein